MSLFLGGKSVCRCLGVFSVANTWINVGTPHINMLVSRREWYDLDQLFLKNLFRSALMFLFGMGIILYVTHSAGGRIPLRDRFVDIYSMYFLGVGWFCQIIVNGIAIYLRAHKEEPLAIPSLLSSIYVLITTFLCAKYLEPQYFFLGYLSHYIWGMPWLLFLFRKKREDHLRCMPMQITC